MESQRVQYSFYPALLRCTIKKVVLTFIKNVSMNTECLSNVIAFRYKFDNKYNRFLMTLPWHLFNNSQVNFNITRVNHIWMKTMYLVDSAALFIARFFITINTKKSFAKNCFDLIFWVFFFQTIDFIKTAALFDI